MPFIPRDGVYEDLLVEHADLVVQAAALQRTVERINSSLFTPVDPEDILMLSRGLDACLDGFDAVADLLVLFDFHELPEGVAEQVAVLQRQAELTRTVMSGLRRSKDRAEYWAEIERLENRGGKLFRRMVATLLQEGSGYPGGTDEALKAWEVLSRLDSIVDAFAAVAAAVETIAVKAN
ncbi:MAG: phosphate transport regulator [Micrococcales bacterium]|nr:MAG: phosphate transport regulator [Micrococcales bacterium]